MTGAHGSGLGSTRSSHAAMVTFAIAGDTQSGIVGSLPSELGVRKEQEMRTGTKWLIALLAALAAIAVLVPSIAMGALGMGGMGSSMMGSGMMGQGMMGQGMMGSCPMAGTGMSGACTASGAGMMADSGWTRGLIIGASGLATLALWGAVVVAAVLAVRWLIGRTTTDAEPLSILQRRFAAGEIDSATYAEMRAELNA